MIPRIGLLIAMLAAFSAFAADSEGEPSGVHWGVMPIGNYTTDEGFTFGAFARRFDYGDPGQRPFDNLLTLQVSYAPKGTRGAFIELERTRGLWDWRSRLTLYGLASDREPYYGVGEDTSISPSIADGGGYFYSSYRLGATLDLRKDIEGDPRSGWSLRGGVSPLFLFEKPAAESDNGGIYARDFGQEIRRSFTTRVFAGWVLEDRDNEFSARDGEAAGVRVSVGPGLLSSGVSTWAAFDADFRWYRAIFDHPFPLTFALQLRESSATVSTPLSLKPELGGFLTQRGLVQGRYVANHTATLRTELRSFIFKMKVFGLPLRGGGGIFGELGRAGDQFGRLFESRTRPSWGFTFFGSYFTDDFVGRADIGFSPEGFSTYIGLGHAI